VSRESPEVRLITGVDILNSTRGDTKLINDQSYSCEGRGAKNDTQCSTKPFGLQNAPI
jgi:hypothetical protein